mmetsp:Transcript_35614/g.85935  ORF Transcript_35614/g.85935 Transcript_35614/m.85935 type:complete len:270 (+) Transcript_35614:441-1250(+)
MLWVKRLCILQQCGAVEYMKDMRAALEGAGLGTSELGKCVDQMDVAGVRRYCEYENINNEENKEDTKKALLTACDNFKLLFETDNTDGIAYKSMSDIICHLLRAGVDANSYPTKSNNPSPMVEAPLHIITSSVCAAYSRDPNNVKLTGIVAAVSAIRELHAQNAELLTETMDLLPRAAHRGSIQEVKFLVETVGVDPNYCGRQGMNSLILASRGGKLELARVLLGYPELDLKIMDNQGKTAMDYAAANKKVEIVKLLQERSLPVFASSE